MINDFSLAPIWYQVHVATWDAMIIIKLMSQGRNAIASQDGMVLHVTKIHVLRNHVKMQEYATERSQNRETKLMTSYTAKYLRYYLSLDDLRMIKVVGASFSCDCPTGYWGTQCEFSPCDVAAGAPPRCTAGTKKTFSRISF